MNAETSRPVQRHHGFQLRAGAHGQVSLGGVLRHRALCAGAYQTKEARHPLLAGYCEAEQLLRDGVDILTGGFPCQDISAAGKGAGIQFDRATGKAATRSGLFGQLVRTIRLVRPRVALLENVAALLSRGMGTVLGEMAEIGYDTEWHCISAADVGAPHLRERIWIMAHPTSIREGREADAEKPLIADQSRSWLEEKRNEISNTEGERCGETRQHCQRSEERASGCSETLANTSSQRCARSRQPEQPLRATPRREGQTTYAQSIRIEPEWPVEPDVGRVADGIPNRVDRLKGLGNAIVPQIAEILGEAAAERLGV